jgi:hypothetical protein
MHRTLRDDLSPNERANRYAAPVAGSQFCAINRGLVREDYCDGLTMQKIQTRVSS